MKTISAAFLTMIQTSENLVGADLFTFTLADGTVMRWTSADQSITYAANVYSTGGTEPGVERGLIKCAVGLGSDNLDITLLFSPATRINNLTPGAFVSAGGFDNAKIEVSTGYAPDWSNPVVNGVVNKFTGIVSETRSMAGSVKLTCNSMLRFINTSFPRNYYLPACQHALFDSGCTLLAANFSAALTVSGTTTTTSFGSGATEADGYFNQGYVIWTSGANQGIRTYVKSFIAASFVLAYPLPFAPAVGDTFTAYAGCDKTQATCQAKFANLPHFRGFPFVPIPETLEVGQAGSPPVSYTPTGGGNSARGHGPGGTFTKFKIR